MSWKGRILGAIIGLLFSPIGSVIGFILGYFFYDKSRNQQVKLQSQQQQHAKNSFLEAHYATRDHEQLLQSAFRLMGYVARGAGRINEAHIKQAEHVMDTLNLNSTQRASAIKNFSLGKSGDFNFIHEITLLKHVLGANNSMRSYFMELLVGIVVIDQNIASGERDRLFRIGGYVGVSTSELDVLIEKRLREISPQAQTSQQERPAQHERQAQREPAQEQAQAKAEAGAAQTATAESSSQRQPSRSHKGWLLVVVLVLGIIGGGGWWAYHNKIFVTSENLHKFCDLHNNGIACYRLATRYAQGKGVPQDSQLAQKYFQRGCELHNAKACTYVAQARMQGQTPAVAATTADAPAPAPKTPAMSDQEIEQLRNMLLEGENSRNVLNIETQDQAPSEQP